MSGLSPLLYNQELEEIFERDFRKFWRDALLNEIVTEQELRVLFQLRLHGTSLEDVAKEYKIPPEYVRLNSISVRLRLQQFIKNWRNDRR